MQLKKNVPTLLFLLGAAALTLLLFSKSSPLYPLNDWVDANCFLTTGKAVLSGKVLYRDVYEQKGPLLYFAHAAAALLSDASFLGVWILEVLAAWAFACIGYALVRRRVPDAAPFLILGLLFLTFSTTSFASGDSAEELGLPFLALPFVMGMTTDWKRELPSNRQAFAAGWCAGVLLWIKYTLCGFFIAFVLFVIVAACLQKKPLRLLPLSGCFLLGLLTISAPILLYFLANNALDSLWQTYFVNNITLYSPTAGGARGASGGMLETLTGYAGQNPVFVVLLVIGLVGSFRSSLTEGLFLLCSLLGCFPFISLGSRPYPYYAFIVAAFTISGWTPLMRGLSLILPSRRWISAALALLLSAGMGVYAYGVSLNTYLLGTDREAMPQFRFAQLMWEDSTDEEPTLLNYGFLDGGFYTAAGITPSSRFFCRLNIDLDDMNQELSASVQEGRTQYVVTRGRGLSSSNYELVDQASFVYQSNAESPRSFTYYLYRLKDQPAPSSPSRRRKGT